MNDCYGAFAQIYDRLMHRDFSYSQWADYVENLFDHYDLSPRLVCELACGTGNLTLPLAARGYEMIGVDLSADMLSIARTKAAKEKQDILFLNQDMTKLDLYGTVDAVLCLIDGINYVLTPQSLFSKFQKIKTCFLNPGGIVIFDLSTEYKLAKIVGNHTFVHDSDRIFYTWENRYFPKHRVSDMQLHFFVQEKDGRYQRFFERHIQRTYRPEQLIMMLKKAGFSKIDVFDALRFVSPDANSQRIVFVAQ